MADEVEPVALLGGTGHSGPGLALRFALAGVPVVIGSRDAGRGEAAAREVTDRVRAHGGGAEIHGTDNSGAVRECGVVIVTVPFAAQGALLLELRPQLEGRVIVSTAIPLAFERGRGPSHVEVAEGSAAEQVAVLVPAARVVGALHSLSSTILSDPGRGVDSDVVVTGDDDDAKRRVTRLVELLPGVRAVDGGALRYSRYSEQLTVLLLSINRRYRAHAGVRITDLPDR